MATQTNELRRVIESRLNSIKTQFNISKISYRQASPDAMYPHITYDLTGANPTEHGRHDYTIDIHVWTKDQFAAFAIGDTVADLFSYVNSPQETILPTFYETSVFQVEDQDTSICHVVVRLEGQNYKTNGGFQWQT